MVGMGSPGSELVNTGFRSTLLVGTKKLFLKHGIKKSNILKV